MKRIYLLDLNFTLVENSDVKAAPFTRQIAGEVYRQWLVERLRPEHVLLVTARPFCHRVQTLKSILDKTGWQPQGDHFNTSGQRPPVWKEFVLTRLLFPKHGNDPRLYFGIESNPATRAMYARHGVQSMSQEDFRTYEHTD